MLKTAIALLAVVARASVCAEPIVYICERPAWGDHEGCGPKNTYHTYGFWVDTENFDTAADKATFLYREPKYIYTQFQGCEPEKVYENKGQFTATDTGFTFWLGKAVTNTQKVELDTITMTAQLKGHRIKHNPDLTCEEVKGDAINLLPARPVMSIAPAFVQPGSR